MRFVDAYRRQHGISTTSQVVTRALEHLRVAELEQAYAQAAHEVAPEWDVVAGDGLEPDAS